MSAAFTREVTDLVKAHFGEDWEEINIKLLRFKYGGYYKVKYEVSD